MSDEPQLEWRGREVTAEVERVMAERLRDALDLAAARVRAEAPVRSGALRASVTTEVAPDGLSGAVVVLSDHAAPVALGHFDRQTYVPPNPFLQRAMISVANRVQRKLAGQ